LGEADAQIVLRPVALLGVSQARLELIALRRPFAFFALLHQAQITVLPQQKPRLFMKNQASKHRADGKTAHHAQNINQHASPSFLPCFSA
jgi:hypothetical protein